MNEKGDKARAARSAVLYGVRPSLAWGDRSWRFRNPGGHAPQPPGEAATGDYRVEVNGKPV